MKKRDLKKWVEYRESAPVPCEKEALDDGIYVCQRCEYKWGEWCEPPKCKTRREVMQMWADRIWRRLLNKAGE